MDKLQQSHRALLSWLMHIQAAMVNAPWQTAGDFYRGKQLCLPQDTINLIDTAIEQGQQLLDPSDILVR